jgi:hypothetical protein
MKAHIRQKVIIRKSERFLFGLTNALLGLLGLKWFHAQYDKSEDSNIRLIDVEKNEDIACSSVWFVGPTKPGIEFKGFVVRVRTVQENKVLRNPATDEPFYYKFYGRFKWERKA